jgi:hypothetical protein
MLEKLEIGIRHTRTAEAQSSQRMMVFSENPETRILTKPSGLRPEEQGGSCLSVSPDKEESDFLCDLSASAVK